MFKLGDSIHSKSVIGMKRMMTVLSLELRNNSIAEASAYTNECLFQKNGPDFAHKGGGDRESRKRLRC